MSVIDIFNRDRAARRAGLINGMTQRFQKYRTYRQTLDELEALSDRELADLDLHRSMLRAIAYRAAYDG